MLNIHFHTDINKQAIIYLYNSTGKLVHSGVFKSGNDHTVNVNELEPGIYLIKIIKGRQLICRTYL